ncbi:MAG TPA: maleylpyruvate isomerase family mycothiol-dependent enzyme [Acidimicrobiales bacterium]
MQLSPRYDGPPVLRLDLDLGDPSVPMVRQRRRLGDVLSRLDEAQWNAASRCEAWSVRDVVCHLVTTNQFWTISITKALAGEPTRYLSTFDPVSSPAEIVDSMKAMTPAEILAAYVDTVDELAACLANLDEAKWSTIAEAPLGHVGLEAVTLHALWDSWIHERDIVLPLGLSAAVEDDEVVGCLVYASALGPAFTASTGSERPGSLAVVATDPDVSFVIEHGSTVVVHAGPVPSSAPQLRGAAVALVEGLSFRVPLSHGLDDSDVWLLGALGDVFDVTSTTSQ